MISIIIPTYNAALLIERTVRSVLAQRGEPDFEILIVDDVSTDNTLDVVRGIGDSRIKIFQQDRNQGPGAARNHGLKEAKGEYCAFLDGDDYWEPDFLLRTSDFLSKHSEAVAVSVMQCHKIIGKAPAISPNNTGIETAVILEDFFAFWSKYNHVCTGSVLMRTDVAKATGGQREDLRVCEDLEFWALLATYGKWGFIPQVLFTSDGGLITKKYGNKNKNNERVKHIKPINEWGRRLRSRISDTDWSKCTPILNRITIAGTYSLLRIGQWDKAKQILSYYIRTSKQKYPIPAKALRYGHLSWFIFTRAFWFYKHIKDWKNGI